MMIIISPNTRAKTTIEHHTPPLVSMTHLIHDDQTEGLLGNDNDDVEFQRTDAPSIPAT